jgi:hypothetical protein
VKGDVAETGLGFAMLKLVCHDPEGQSLDPSLCLQLRGAISEDAREFGDFGNPPPIFLSIKLDLESHCLALRLKSTPYRPLPLLPGEH